MNAATLTDILYLLASILFIFGLKGLTHPRSAVRGNLYGASAMLIAIVAVLLDGGMDWGWVLSGLIVGTAIGAVFAVKIRMESMPQLVALFNGFGGAASLLVALASTWTIPEKLLPLMPFSVILATAASAIIGAITFTGSLVAFAKLQELPFVRKVKIPQRELLNIACVVAVLVFAVLAFTNPGSMFTHLMLCSLFALLLGIGTVFAIGGADMPVVIALLNSYSGLAAAATGFIFANPALIVSGSLVGASGLILTQIMCKAMNRSLVNVLFGSIQGGRTVADADEVYRSVKQTSADEVAILLDGVQRVVIVPGYGMAVAQAQHAVRDLTNLLVDRGVDVEFAIHPVAGRMPGHMNVLLAEVDIPYERLREMDDINPTLDQADVVIVLGANDVVNPDAKNDPNSPIFGMPIIDVDRARTVVVIKRSLSPGFAGIPNPLFAADNALMLFGDGQAAVQELITALKENA